MKKQALFFFSMFLLCNATFAQKAELMIPSGSGSLSCVAYTADERILFTGGGITNTQIKIWDVKSGRLLKTLTHPDAGVLASLPNQQAIAFCGMNNGKIYTLSATDFKPTLFVTLPYGFSCYKMTATPDGKSLLLGGGSYIGQFWCPFIYKVNLSNGSYSVLTKLEPYATDPKVGYDFSEMDISKDGRYLFARTNSSNPQQPPHSFYVIDANTGAVVNTPKGGLFYMSGNKLIKIYSKKIDAENTEYTASLVSLPDFGETAPVKLDKFITYFSQWNRRDYLFDESNNVLYHAIGYDRGGNIVKLDMTSGKILQKAYPTEDEDDIAVSSFSHMPKTKKLIVGFSSTKYGKGINIIDANSLKSEHILGNVFPHLGGAVSFNPVSDALEFGLKAMEIGKKSGNIKVHQIDSKGVAAWSPDGSKLAYLDRDKREYGILDATDLTAKPKTSTYSTNIVSIGSPLIWTPDSKKFIYGTLNQFLQVEAPSLTSSVRNIGYVGYQSQHNVFSKNGQFIIQPRANASKLFPDDFLQVTLV